MKSMIRALYRRQIHVIASTSALLALTSLAPADAPAKGEPDQSTGDPCCFLQLVGNNGGGVDEVLGQSFTAGRTGFLDTAELFISQQAGIGGRYRVRLTGVRPDSAPDDRDVATAVLDVCRQDDPPSAVTFSPAPAIRAGQRYALVVEYMPGTGPDHQAYWMGAAHNLEGGFPWAKDRAAAPPVWQSIWLGVPLSLYTYVSATRPPVVGRDATASTMSARPDAVKRLQPVALEAKVVDLDHASMTPAGTVSFVIDGSAKPAVALDATGTARDTATFGASGSHTVTASYCPAAASTLISSESAGTPITVSAENWPTATALTSIPIGRSPGNR
jgi:hypothetical protein